MADIDPALRAGAVVGIEQMRNVPGEQAAQFIGGPAMGRARMPGRAFSVAARFQPAR
jgi:hypothetical protein